MRLVSIARGGMGSVDVALRTDGNFQRLCAVKRILPHYLDSESARTMFTAEARLAGLIRHANVVGVLDVGQDAEGPYLVMDYIEGLPLHRVLHPARPKAPPPLAFALQVVAQAAAGLHAAHTLCDAGGQPLQLVHRDISPSNLLVGFDGVVRVSDFGIAKAIAENPTTTVGLRGKLPYMAPEQLRFERPDARADIFALGCVLFEALTQKVLFKSVDTTPRQLAHYALPSRDDVGPELPEPALELLRAMLAHRREERPPTARDVAMRLSSIVASRPEYAAFDLATYMEAAFDEERSAFADRIRAARTSLDAISVPAEHGDLVGSDDLTLHRVAEDASTRPRVPAERADEMVAESAVTYSAAVITKPERAARRERQSENAAPPRANKPHADTNEPQARAWVRTGAVMLVGAALAAGVLLSLERPNSRQTEPTLPLAAAEARSGPVDHVAVDQAATETVVADETTPAATQNESIGADSRFGREDGDALQRGEPLVSPVEPLTPTVGGRDSRDRRRPRRTTAEQMRPTAQAPTPRPPTESRQIPVMAWPE